MTIYSNSASAPLLARPDRTGSSSKPAAPFDLPERFWSIPYSEVFHVLDCTPDGLTSAEVPGRLSICGHNRTNEASRRYVLARVGRRLAEPLVTILLVAAALSGSTGDWASFILILLVLASSITLDVVQEHRAETAAEALKRSVAIRSRAWRDGSLAQVSSDEIVPGDILELPAGDMVPADGIVLESRAARTNEALLTGEPYPVDKRAGPSGAAVAAEAANALFG